MASTYSATDFCWDLTGSLTTVMPFGQLQGNFHTWASFNLFIKNNAITQCVLPPSALKWDTTNSIHDNLKKKKVKRKFYYWRNAQFIFLFFNLRIPSIKLKKYFCFIFLTINNNFLQTFVKVEVKYNSLLTRKIIFIKMY